MSRKTIIEENFPGGMALGGGTLIGELATEEVEAEKEMEIRGTMIESPLVQQTIEGLITMIVICMAEEKLVSG